MTAEGRFLMLPAEIAARTDLTGTAKVVFCAIADRVGKNFHAFPGMRRIARDSGCGLYAVKAAISKLEAVGLIAVERPSGNPTGRTNRYSILGGRKPTCVDIPIRGANQHVSESAVETCRKAPSRRSANQHITRPIEPDPLNQKNTPPTPPRGSPTRAVGIHTPRAQHVPRGTSDGGVGEAEPIEHIIGPPSDDLPPGMEPHGLPPDRTKSPETNAELPDVVWDALVRYKGSSAHISANLKNRAIKHTDAYGAERVVKAIDKLKAEKKPWGALGHLLAAEQRQEYDRAKPGDDSPARVRSRSGKYDRADIVVD